MSTYDMYTSPVAAGTWDVPAAGAARFSWEYDDGRQRLLDLYQRGQVLVDFVPFGLVQLLPLA